MPPIGISFAVLLAAVGCLAPASVRADARVLLTLEGDFVLPVSEPQRDLFRPGMGGAFSVEVSPSRFLLVGARLRGALLFDGPRPSNPTLADPGIGTFTGLFASVRLRPFALHDRARRGAGFFVDVAGGPALTGSKVRGAFETGLGYLFVARAFELGPVVRYLHVVQPNDAPLDKSDARMLLVGVALTFLDTRRTVVPHVAPPLEPSASDACPNEAEDEDGFEDEDGCPDVDDDRDGIPDTSDACRLEPEDVDGFEDTDGCPELDNDHDSIPDVSDRCPNEPETVNGNDDADGCPDRGLIELIDNRIVLEETVLFDFERARVKHAARPVLEAIVRLTSQHPEWARIRIEGHADNRGDAEYNQSLSEDRARNVMEALVALGLPSELMTSAGFGATQPRDTRTTEIAHQRNRRVEFVILAYSGRENVPAAGGGAGR